MQKTATFILGYGKYFIKLLMTSYILCCTNKVKIHVQDSKLQQNQTFIPLLPLNVLILHNVPFLEPLSIVTWKIHRNYKFWNHKWHDFEINKPNACNNFILICLVDTYVGTCFIWFQIFKVTRIGFWTLF